MRAALSLLLPCLLAQVWPDSGPGPWTLPSPTPRPEPAEEEDGPPPRPRGQQLSRDTSALGFGLLRKLSMRQEGNVLFSPLSLAAAVAALMLGTPPAANLTRAWHRPPLFGPLRERLSHTRELGLTQGSVAFVHEDFDASETFLGLARRYFATECVTVNFRNTSQAAGLLNRHVNRMTRGRVPRLVRRVDPDTQLMLVDFILFAGRWRTPFDPVLTEVDTFRLDEYQAVKVPMMYRAGDFASAFDENLRCHVLRLPYRGNASMLVVLTEKMGEHLALEDYLTADLVDTWLRNMKTRHTEVFLPKFQLDQEYEMHELLKQMGVRSIFAPWADLGGLSATARTLKVSKVVQRAAITVDEQGTDAVAGTLSEIVAYAMPPRVKVDRPFHFVIYEDASRVPLFLGRVVDPAPL